MAEARILILRGRGDRFSSLGRGVGVWTRDGFSPWVVQLR